MENDICTNMYIYIYIYIYIYTYADCNSLVVPDRVLLASFARQQTISMEFQVSEICTG